MKFAFIIFSIFLGTAVWSQNTPKAAIQDFEQRFSHDVDVATSWEALDNGFKVSYTSEVESGFIMYDDEGNFRSSMVETSFDLLRDEVKTYIRDNYSVKKVKTCYLLNSATAPERCVVVIKYKKIDVTVYFRPDGTFHYQE